jgi:hypothetical protein
MLLRILWILPVVILLVVLAFVCKSFWHSIRESNNYYNWQIVTAHIPKWVRKNIEKIKKEGIEVPDSSPNAVLYLNGRRFNYRLIFCRQDGTLLKIERKRKKYNRIIHIWEEVE